MSGKCADDQNIHNLFMHETQLWYILSIAFNYSVLFIIYDVSDEYTH